MHKVQPFCNAFAFKVFIYHHLELGASIEICLRYILVSTKPGTIGLIQNTFRWRSDQFQPTHNIGIPWSNETDANLEDSAVCLRSARGAPASVVILPHVCQLIYQERSFLCFNLLFDNSKPTFVHHRNLYFFIRVQI